MYGYNPPKKIQRKLPLQIRAADPSLCLNLIDDMYAMYTEIQVCFFPFHFCEYF